jgi:hypothetical protein
MAKRKNTQKPNSIDNPYYLSAARIRKVATELIDEMTWGMAERNIPTPYDYELKTDEATVELRRAIEKYIATMQDERLPYEAPDSVIATDDDPLGEVQEVMTRINGLFRLDKETWAELDRFIDEEGDAVIKEYGLEEGDLDDGAFAITAWIASLAKKAEREKQPQVDAAVRHLLEPSTPA